MKTAPYLHRAQAGQVLARALASYAGRQDVTVLALPHGGVPVAFEIARALGAPLELLVVQPIRHILGPPRREVTLGLLGYPPAVHLQESTLNALNLSEAALGQALSLARRQLRQRVRALRPAAPPPSLSGRTVLVVDEGVAAGVMLRRAAGLLRRAGARELVAAVPVGAREGLRLLGGEFDDVVCPEKPEPFVSVSSGYAHLPEVSDAEVRALLARAREIPHPSPLPGGAGACTD